jgi:hypothetical protein
MQSSFSNPQDSQFHTDATRHAAPAGCSSFTPEQERELDAAYMAWVNSGYAAREGEAYASARRKIQYAAMLRSV